MRKMVNNINVIDNRFIPIKKYSRGHKNDFVVLMPDAGTKNILNLIVIFLKRDALAIYYYFLFARTSSITAQAAKPRAITPKPTVREIAKGCHQGVR